MDHPWCAPVVLAASLVIAPQEGTFRSRVEAVRVDALVTLGGRPVVGLSPAEFEVWDNGVRQRIDQASFDEIALNLVIALDASSSVEGTRALRLRTATRGALNGLKPNERAALITFGEAIVMPDDLTRDLSRIRRAVDEPFPPGQTSLADASYAALLLAESQPGRSLVIVFSDGVDVSSYIDPAAVIEAAKRSDAVLYGVALKSVSRPPFLRDLAEASGGDLFEIKSSAQLDDAFAKVLEQFRSRYLFSYTPTGVERRGWHRLDVRVKRGGAAVRARPGYFRD